MKIGFAFNLGKSLQIYFFCAKRQAKINFLKDVKSTVGHSLLYLSQIFKQPFLGEKKADLDQYWEV